VVFFGRSYKRSAYFDDTGLVIVLGTSQEGSSNKVSGTSQEAFSDKVN